MRFCSVSLKFVSSLPLQIEATLDRMLMVCRGMTTPEGVTLEGPPRRGGVMVTMTFSRPLQQDMQLANMRESEEGPIRRHTYSKALLIMVEVSLLHVFVHLTGY